MDHLGILYVHIKSYRWLWCPSVSIKQPPFTNLTRLEIRLPCTTFRKFFLLPPLITPIPLNWVLLAFNKAQETTVLNFVVKVFPLQLTKHIFVCLPCIINITFFALRLCRVGSVLLLEAPRAFFLADGMYPNIQMKYYSGTGSPIFTLSRKACIVRTSCLSTFSFNQGDWKSSLISIFARHFRSLLLASTRLIPSPGQVFRHDPQVTHKFHTFSVAKACQFVLSSVRMESPEFLNLEGMASETLADITRPVAQNNSSITSATSAALSSYLPTTFCLLRCYELCKKPRSMKWREWKSRNGIRITLAPSTCGKL